MLLYETHRAINGGPVVAAREGADQREANLSRLLAECVPVSADELGAADRQKTAQRIATGIGLAVFVPKGDFDSVMKCGHLYSQRELLRLRLRKAPDTETLTSETVLGTADDVFTYAGPCRYLSARTGVAIGVGLLFRWEIELERSEDAVATPFDSGAVFKFLRPNDPPEEQVAFVHRHELPIPQYRRLLEHYLVACFREPPDYVRGIDPICWPIPVQGGDARRWTFEVRFQKRLSINHRLLAVLIPKAMAAEPLIMAQTARWRAMGVELPPPFSGARRPLSRQLAAETVQYWLKHLGV